MNAAVSFGAMNDDELVEAYVRVAVENGTALDRGDYLAANQHYDRGTALSRELLNRNLESRLRALLNHPEPWVEFWAAGDLLALLPNEATATLHRLTEVTPPGVLRLSATTALTEWRKKQGVS
jgi:hypothetical protein